MNKIYVMKTYTYMIIICKLYILNLFVLFLQYVFVCLFVFCYL